MSSNQIELATQVWTQITTSEKSGDVLHLSGRSQVVYTVSPTQPNGFDETTPSSHYTITREGFSFKGIAAADLLWAYAITGAVILTITPSKGLELSTDAAYFSGEKAINTQSYTATNVKLGLQFGISEEILIPSGGTVYYSFKPPLGANTVIIKNRLLSANGGMRYTPRSGAVFNETGTPVPTPNLNKQSANISGVVCLELDNVPSDIGTKFDVIRSADGRENRQVQGIFAGDGFERVLAKGAPILLQFENLDNFGIYVIFNVSWFEGVPDLTAINPI
jgi:hypothetical protein